MYKTINTCWMRRGALLSAYYRNLRTKPLVSSDQLARGVWRDLQHVLVLEPAVCIPVVLSEICLSKLSFSTPN